MFLSALLLASSPGIEPIDEQVRRAAPIDYSTCVFLGSVCVCTAYFAETVEGVACVEDETTGEITCNYNVLFTDGSGMEGKHWQQRSDVFRRGDAGELKWVKAAAEPTIYDSFDVPRDFFGRRGKAGNPRRSLRRFD